MSTSPSAFVIGCGPGIGSAVAKLFAKKGFNIGLIARSQSTLDKAVSDTSIPGIKLSGRTADASDYKALENALDGLKEELGSPSIVVYNVASVSASNRSLTVAPKPLDTLSVTDLEEHIRICAVGAFCAAQWAAKNMQNPPGGTKRAILMTGGGLAMYPRIPTLEGLAAGKAALRNITQGLHDFYKPAGIHVAIVTVVTYVKEEDPKYNPTSIAEEYWKLYEQSGDWTNEIVY